MRMLYITWKAYGFGCYLAKTDLKGAFRQLWLASDQPFLDQKLIHSWIKNILLI